MLHDSNRERFSKTLTLLHQQIDNYKRRGKDATEFYNAIFILTEGKAIVTGNKPNRIVFFTKLFSRGGYDKRKYIDKKKCF